MGSNYYLPDFGYVYKMNALQFELFANCNGTDIGCNYLFKIANSTQTMMLERAQQSQNSNFLLVQHFPSVGADTLNKFKTKRAENASNINDIAWMAYGHLHSQQCDASDANGNCELIRTGGGGGCCNEETLRGFYVIGFDDNKNMIQPMSITDERLTCKYPCNAKQDAMN